MGKACAVWKRGSSPKSGPGFWVRERGAKHRPTNDRVRARRGVRQSSFSRGTGDKVRRLLALADACLLASHCCCARDLLLPGEAKAERCKPKRPRREIGMDAGQICRWGVLSRGQGGGVSASSAAMAVGSRAAAVCSNHTLNPPPQSEQAAGCARWEWNASRRRLDWDPLA